MSTGAKIAIGCGGFAVVAGVIAVSAVVGGAYWVKGKAEGFVASTEKLEKLREQADANPFTPPADGVIPEKRLNAYLTVRKSQTAFMTSRKSQIDAATARMSKPGASASLSDISEGVSFISDLQTNFYGALAAEKMSDTEYRWLVFEVYRAEFSSKVEKDNGGKTPSQVTAETADAALKGIQASKDNPDAANLPPEFKQNADSMGDMMSQIAQQARSGSKAMDPPQANVELVRKYDDDIHKYALSGNESAGM
jgi:hypothetical protein